MEDDNRIMYGVYRVGGSIGEQSGYTKRINGRAAKLLDTYYMKPNAKLRAKKLRQRLSPGEKGYYKMSYVVSELNKQEIADTRFP